MVFTRQIRRTRGFFFKGLVWDLTVSFGRPLEIASIRQNVNKECRRCRAGNETLIHAIKNRPSALAMLSCGGLDGRLINNNYESCIDWLEESMRLLDKKAIADFITLLWNSWNNTNNFIFHGKEEEASVIWERAITLSKDFRIHNLVNKSMLPITSACKKWEKPSHGFAKVNFDAVVSNGRMGFGVIVRDDDGFVLDGSGGFKEAVMDGEWVELTAFEESMNVAGSLNIMKVMPRLGIMPANERLKVTKALVLLTEFANLPTTEFREFNFEPDTLIS
ncbi:hypothetical protein CXB51_003683 [Gossypium anomalum]|uniref:RNase H type-1 domain-containing protein n=1 Tax=Gossypium anomalum TaxID=47600 RepID=A0A8J5Z4A1_9ROSI|nr:hypothetical protein CXB51_003683 [Gossypium anomalum]